MRWLSGTQLTSLHLARSEFSDSAIQDLPDTLEYLDLTRTRISDAGLMGFVRLKRLKKLLLLCTPTSAEGIEDLQSRMKSCDIRWEPLKIRWDGKQKAVLD